MKVSARCGPEESPRRSDREAGQVLPLICGIEHFGMHPVACGAQSFQARLVSAGRVRRKHLECIKKARRATGVGNDELPPCDNRLTNVAFFAHEGVTRGSN